MKAKVFVSSAAVLVLCLSMVGSLEGAIQGLWEFNNPGNPAQATIGNDLIFSGVAPSYAASITDDAAKTLNGVITTAPAVNANRIRADHGIAPNGGGVFVNQYSIVTDIFSPVGSRSSWRSIFQTNTSNANDGEYFIRNNNDFLGVGDLGYSTAAVDDSEWTRLVLTVDLTESGGDVKAYLDGSLFYSHPGNPAVDGRFSLDPFLYFFADDNGDNAPLNVATLAIYDEVLTAAQVAALGSAGSAIVPEPASVMMWILLGAGLFYWRRRGNSA